MQYKIRRYCPRCKTWVSQSSQDFCGLHKCFCGGKFHSLDILKKHLSVIHYYDYQQIAQFLYVNPKSKSGNMQTKGKSEWFNNVFCVSCSNYLNSECDQCRFCKRIKCTDLVNCTFIAHSKDHMTQHLTEVHARMPFEKAKKSFFDQWSETIWAKDQYFLCNICDSFVTYPNGDKNEKLTCNVYKCPIAFCESNTKGKPFHDVDHLLGHMKQSHQYRKCNLCLKFLPPNITDECQQIFCEGCHLLHHNNGDVEECKLTLNIADMKAVC